MASTVSSGSQVSNFALDFSPAKTSYQTDAALAFVGFFYGGVEDAERGFPDVAAGTVTFDEGDDGVVGNGVLAVGVADPFAVCWDGYAVV